MVGVAWNGTEQSMQGFIDRHDLTFPNIRDDTAQVFTRFGVPYQPAWVFVAADGTAERTLGALSEAKLADQLDELAGA